MVRPVCKTITDRMTPSFAFPILKKRLKTAWKIAFFAFSIFTIISTSFSQAQPIKLGCWNQLPYFNREAWLKIPQRCLIPKNYQGPPGQYLVQTGQFTDRDRELLKNEPYRQFIKEKKDQAIATQDVGVLPATFFFPYPLKAGKPQHDAWVCSHEVADRILEKGKEAMLEGNRLALDLSRTPCQKFPGPLYDPKSMDCHPRVERQDHNEL